MKVIPAALKHTDLLIGEGVVKSEKRLKDTSFFADSAGVDPDLVLYEVYARTDQAKEGELNWGLSLLHPVTVNGECCMTRGHWHENTDAAEYYWCVGGTGLLLLMDEQGHAWAEEMEPGSLHHIPGVLAHRLINTGDEDLKVACCWRPPRVMTMHGWRPCRFRKEHTRQKKEKSNGSKVRQVSRHSGEGT